MRRSHHLLLGAAVTLGAIALGAQTPIPAPASFEIPAWAFPMPAPSAAPAPRPDSVTPRHVPGSRVTFTETQARNPFAAPDWYPESHAPMPSIVARGRPPGIIACGYCHLPDGGGRPENAMLAGLPAEYIVRQMAEIKAHERVSAWRGSFAPVDNMRRIAEQTTEAEVAEAASYFSSLKPRRRSRVVEAREIPHPVPAVGLYFPPPDGAREPLGQRMIAMASSAARHELRDPETEYVTYVPKGSVGRGKKLVERGRGASVPACASCHGASLRGTAQAPPLAGHFPSYLLRQLLAYKAGTRASAAAAPMRAVAARLELGDMIDAAAYAGTRKP